MWEREVGSFSLGDFAVESGGVIKGAQIGWERHGTLNAARDNLIVYPSSYSAQHGDLAWSIGPDKILDPTRWCILAIDMFSNGVSSGAAETADYPALVTMGDNVRAQQRLVAEQFGVSRVAAGVWVLHGRNPGVSLGVAVSRDGRPCVRRLRQRTDGGS